MCQSRVLTMYVHDYSFPSTPPTCVIYTTVAICLIVTSHWTAGLNYVTSHGCWQIVNSKFYMIWLNFRLGSQCYHGYFICVFSQFLSYVHNVVACGWIAREEYFHWIKVKLIMLIMPMANCHYECRGQTVTHYQDMRMNMLNMRYDHT